MLRDVVSKIGTGILRSTFGDDVLSRSAFLGSAESTRQFSEASTLTLSLPSRGDVPPRITEFAGTYQFDRPFVTLVEEAELFGQHGIGQTADESIILETTSNGDQTPQLSNTAFEFWSSVASHRLTSPFSSPETRSGVYCPLFSRWNGYFHWLFDHLPKLEAVEYYESQTGDDVTLIIPPSPAGWMLDTLEVLGYDTEDYLEWPGGRVQVEQLLVPSLRRYRDVPHPDAVHWLRNRVLNVTNSRSGGTEFSERVYVSRRDASDRRVKNEAALLDSLSELGFELYVPGELPIVEQVRLFDQAEIVVGPHGSNLANIVFASDTRLVELIHEGDFSTCYYAISEILGFEYACLRCDPTGSDIVVDPQSVRETAVQLLE